MHMQQCVNIVHPEIKNVILTFLILTYNTEYCCYAEPVQLTHPLSLTVAGDVFLLMALPVVFDR